MKVEEMIREVMANGDARCEYRLLYHREPSEAELADFRPKYEEAIRLGLYDWQLESFDGLD